MSYPGEVAKDNRDGVRDFNLVPDQSHLSRSSLAQHALCCYETAMVGGTAQDKATEKTEETKDKTEPAKERGRLDADDFDIALPLSNFRVITDKVSRSGRPLVDKGGLDELLEKLHPGEDKATQRKDTAIIELRDEDQQMDTPAITALNKGEVLGEEKMCTTSTPPIEYHRFKMVSKDFQSPEKIDDVVTTIQKAVDAGKKVSLHCFHGSDRSGLVSAAYLLSQDANLKQKLTADPGDAYKEVRRRMIDDGCDPASYTKLFQSLKQYCDWKHEQLNGRSGTDGKNPVAVKDEPIDAKGQARIDSETQSMFSDKRFATDPVAVYKEKLKAISDDFDPATNSALYKALKQKYIDGPPADKQKTEKKTGEKTGLMWLPQVSLVA